MARGYLGRISALVTANTTDFQAKLNASAKDVRAFAASMQSTLATASTRASASLKGIYTEAQRVERALKAATSQRLSFKGFDPRTAGNAQDAADAFRRVYSATREIAAPLEASRKLIERLSVGVQGSLTPALASAQAQAEFFFRKLESGGIVGSQTFDRIRQKVEAVGVAASRAAEASEMVGSLATGSELRFTRPDFARELSRAQVAQQQASQLPSSQVADSGFSRLISQQRAAAVEAERLAAAVEAANLAGADIGPQVQAYNQQISLLQKLNSQVERRISLAQVAASEEAFLSGQAQRSSEIQVAAANRLLAAELKRRDAIARRRSVQGFGDDVFAEPPPSPLQTSAPTRKSAALAEAESLIAAFQRLGPESQQALRPAVQQLELFAKNVSEGRQGIESLENQIRLVGETSPELKLNTGNALGKDRTVDALAGQVGAVKSQLETLPGIVQSKFVPAIKQAEAELSRLKSAPNATAEEIDAAAARVRQLAKDAKAAVSAFGLLSFDELASSSAIKQAQGELQALGQVLTRVGAQAGGPAAAAYERLRLATQQAIVEGTIGLPRVRAELERLQVEAARAAADTGRIGFGSALSQIRRGGDVARGAFGNAGLAIQQAAFAVDDFFSVTGGLDQRIRAVGNNLSQLGFIVGGTTGLIAGVAASISAQLVVALIKWANQNVDTQDRVKALNDALASQKNIVEEVARTFDRLADAIASVGGGNENIRRLREQAQAVEDLRREQEKSRRAAAVDADPDVQRERDIQASRRRQLEQSDNLAERVRLRLDIRDSQERERRAAEIAAQRPATDPRQTASRVASLRRARSRAVVFATAPEGANGFVPGELRRIDEQFQQDLNDLNARIQNAGDSLAESLSIITEEIERVRAGGVPGDDPRLIELEQERIRLENQIRRKPIDELAARGLDSAQGGLGVLEQAFRSLDDSIGNAPSQLSFSLQALQNELSLAVRRLKQAQESLAPDALEQTQQAGAQIDEINKRIAAETSAAQSVAAFQAAIDRAAASLFKIVADESRQAADQSRRDANAETARRDLGFSTDQDVEAARRRQGRLEAGAQADSDAELRARQEMEQSRLQFERRARAGQLDPEIQKLINERDRAAQEEQKARRAGDAQAELDARQQRERAQRDIDRRFSDSPEARQARADADQRDALAQQRRQQEESIARGRELARTPADTAARDLGQRLRDFDNAVQEQLAALPANAPAQPVIDGFNNRRQQLIGDDFRARAPAIFSLADSVQNAILQGPSRAALNASDIGTEQGRQELNRLLRGDDPARQADVVELQKQSGLLQTVIDELRKQGVPIVVN